MCDGLRAAHLARKLKPHGYLLKIIKFAATVPYKLVEGKTKSWKSAQNYYLHLWVSDLYSDGIRFENICRVTKATLTEDLHAFPQSFAANAGILSRFEKY